MEENKKKKIIIMIVGVLALLVIVSGTTYAFFSATDKEDAKQITTAKEELDVKIEGSTHVSNIKPTNEFILSRANSRPGSSHRTTNVNKNNPDIVSIPINVTNNSSIDINYNLTLQAKNLKLNSDDSLTGGTTEDIKWVLYKLNSKDGYSNSPESYGDFYDVDFVNKMMTEVSIFPDETHYYLLFIYIEDTEEDQNKLQNISFDVEISGNTKSLDIAGKKLADVILDSSVIKDREPSYKIIKYINEDEEYEQEKLMDMGLYKLENQGIYYYRGEIYNTIYFGETGDIPLMWDVLRVNEDKSVTLIYNGSLISNIMYNSSGKADYVGSEAEQYLKNWYDNTFSEKEKALIQETTFCNDRSSDYNGVMNRLNKENPEPTLECANETDKVNAKVGLLTADEAVYAGALINLNSVQHHYSIAFVGVSGYTMSPASSNNILYQDSSNLCEREVDFSGQSWLSPVITLLPETIISEGVTVRGKFYKSMGTENNPYYINAKEQ